MLLDNQYTTTSNPLTRKQHGQFRIESPNSCSLFWVDVEELSVSLLAGVGSPFVARCTLLVRSGPRGWVVACAGHVENRRVLPMVLPKMYPAVHMEPSVFAVMKSVCMISGSAQKLEH